MQSAVSLLSKNIYTLFVAENIGAVRELSKVTDNLGHRIDELETHTVRMSRYCTVLYCTVLYCTVLY